MHHSIENTALVIAAFGSSRRGKRVLDYFDKEVRDAFPGHELYWGYTSEIIRRKTGTPSVQQTLVRVMEDGFRAAVVLPLQIFPGVEYRNIHETASQFEGLHISVGETLIHRSEFIHEVIDVIGHDFLAPEEGINLLALHGTTIPGDPANVRYLQLAELVENRFENVFAASLEGVPDAQVVMQRITGEKTERRYQKIRILPMTYIAGMHVEDDLMGEEESWRSSLESHGFTVECLKAEYDGAEYYKSLASYGEIQKMFVRRMESGLEKLGLSR